jgi:hypothetical protein
MRRAAVLLSCASLLVFAPQVLGQESPFDPNKSVIPISKLKIYVGSGIGASAKFGTAFCLDLSCKYVATNYHVAVGIGPALKIKGEKVKESYLDTGPQDQGATLNEALDPDVAPMTYTLARDLAVYGLERPLSKRGLRGVALSLDDLEEDQEVDIYAYPLTDRFKVKRSLNKYSAKYAGRTPSGVLAFHFEPSQYGQPIKPGASGGLVIDRKSQQVVGVLVGTSKGTNMAIAAPIQSLADFLKRVKPDLYAEMFPAAEIEGGALSRQFLADFYSPYVPVFNVAGTIQARQEEPAAVKLLRQRAQELADSIKDFIAVQTVTYGGMKNAPPASQFEIRVINGAQRFREYPDGSKDLPELPFPNASPILRPGGEWSTLPNLVGTDLELKIVQAKDVTIGGRQIKVFQYYGAAEDNACGFKEIEDYVLFQRARLHTVSCSGEVWTDQDCNILRISENDDLPPDSHWRNFHHTVFYGWLNKPGEPSRLIPISFAGQAEMSGRTYWYRGKFTKYQVFSVATRILQPGSQESRQTSSSTETSPSQ